MKVWLLTRQPIPKSWLPDGKVGIRKVHQRVILVILRFIQRKQEKYTFSNSPLFLTEMTENSL